MSAGAQPTSVNGYSGCRTSQAKFSGTKVTTDCRFGNVRSARRAKPLFSMAITVRHLRLLSCPLASVVCRDGRARGRRLRIAWRVAHSSKSYIDMPHEPEGCPVRLGLLGRAGILAAQHRLGAARDLVFVRALGTKAVSASGWAVKIISKVVQAGNTGLPRTGFPIHAARVIAIRTQTPVVIYIHRYAGDKPPAVP